jgi:hypothetical protein
MTNLENIHGLRATLEDNPGDWDTRLVLADALAEAGDRVGELAQRYMAEQRIHPSQVNSSCFWWWSFRAWAGDIQRRLGGYALPETIINRLDGHVFRSSWSGGCRLVEYPTAVEAENALGRVLEDLACMAAHARKHEEVIERNPEDWSRRFLLADVLEDLGDEAAAQCQGWMAYHQRRPDCRRVGGELVEWFWYDGGMEDHRWCRSVLPKAIFKHLSGIQQPVSPWLGECVAYNDRITAEADLARALAAHKRKG